MLKFQKPFWSAIFLLILLSLFSGVHAQKKKKVEQTSTGEAVMWEKVDVAKRDLFAGPGGTSMLPDLSRIEFIKEEKAGHNKKYRIKDASGRAWVAKLGREARPETAAVRLLWGLGYKTEVNYLVPTITIPGKGTFKNVRLEARPEHIERLEEWRWKQNPFVGTKELQGLKMMMIFMTNWDAIDIQNKVLQVGNEKHYIVSDLGGTFGRFGNNNLPLFFRLGRKTGSPGHYVKTKFVKEVEGGEVKLATKGAKTRNLFSRFAIEDARWLSRLLNQLSDKQIRDMFRAANFSADEVETYLRAVKIKVGELDRAIGEPDLAKIGR